MSTGTSLNSNRLQCSCGVPLDVHGTCCGWDNASSRMNSLGTIIDAQHPFYTKHINEWINRRVSDTELVVSPPVVHIAGQSIPGTRLVKMEMEMCECGHEVPSDFIIWDKNSCGTCMPCYLQQLTAKYKRLRRKLKRN